MSLKLNLASTASVWARNAFVQWKFGSKGKDKMRVQRSAVKAQDWWPLMQPIQVGNVTYAHRVVASGMTRCRGDYETGALSEMSMEWYRQRMNGGLVVTEAFSVTTDPLTPRVPSITSDVHEAALKNFAELLGDNKKYVSVQLIHIGKVAPNNAIGMSVKEVPKEIPEGHSPSNFVMAPAGQTYRQATLLDLESVRAQFRLGAERVKRAGLGQANVLIAGLLWESLIASQNGRSDVYGKTKEDRARLCCEVLDEVIGVMGARNVGVTLHFGYDVHGGVQAKTDNAAILHFIEHLQRRGVAYILYWNKYKSGTAPVTTEFLEAYQVHKMFLSSVRAIFKGTIIETGFGNNVDQAVERITVCFPQTRALNDLFDSFGTRDSILWGGCCNVLTFRRRESAAYLK